ncbi:MAG: PKD domain-containing protein [Bacteroidales bacterium]|nr:PKD domain-containing protein [Bacteroidales bacterium]
MKPLKFCIVLFVLGGQFFFSSCDNREDYFIDVNKAPSLTLVKSGVTLEGNAYSDSLKIGVPLSLQYLIQDEEKIILQVSQEQQKSTFEIGTEFISFIGATEGQNIFSLTAKDSFNEEAKFSITFTVFRNIVPVAQFTVKKIGVSSPYEYEVDASSSYDRDARFSGKITEYEYTLANYKFSTSLSKIRYVFGSAGQKQIRVRVKDNSGDWSSLVSEYIVLN